MQFRIRTNYLNYRKARSRFESVTCIGCELEIIIEKIFKTNFIPNLKYHHTNNHMLINNYNN